jgi:hypothetical protein
VSQFEESFDGDPGFCSVDDVRAWCSSFSCTLTENENDTYTITPNA